MQSDNPAPSEYDGFRFYPSTDDGIEGFAVSTFDFANDSANSVSVENSSMGYTYHVALFEHDGDENVKVNDLFEAIFVDPMVYLKNLAGTDFFGFFMRKTDKSDALVLEYVDKVTDGEYSRNLKSSLMSIANN
jgi:hypothetical protein